MLQKVGILPPHGYRSGRASDGTPDARVPGERQLLLADFALALVRDSGAIQATVERAARFAQAARAALAAFPDGPARRVLADVADYAVSRVS